MFLRQLPKDFYLQKDSVCAQNAEDYSMKGMFLHTLSILRNLQFALLMVVIVLCLHFDTQVARISTICCSISY